MNFRKFFSVVFLPFTALMTACGLFPGSSVVALYMARVADVTVSGKTKDSVSSNDIDGIRVSLLKESQTIDQGFSFSGDYYLTSYEGQGNYTIIAEDTNSGRSNSFSLPVGEDFFFTNLDIYIERD